jgi:DNA-binding LacI/PurR family transcriptional regulator
MCDLAWQALENRFRDPQAPAQQVVLPTRLLVRASTVGTLGA